MSGRFWGGVSAAVVLAGAGAVQAQDVYTSVVPCRLADTRAAGGTLAAGTVRDFKVTGSGLQGQGGNPLGCEVPAGVATSAVINFVAVNPAGTGNLRAWAYSEPGVAPPNASIINFTTGVNIANGIVVPLCDSTATTCTFDIKVQADGNGAHLVADVVGYFAPADLTVAWSSVTGKPAGFADNVDNDTQYTPGPGLTLLGTEFRANTTYLQRRAGACLAGNSIRAIAEDGTVTCELDDVGSGDITEVATAASSGLTGGVLSGVANLAVDPSDFNGTTPIVDSHTGSVTVLVGDGFSTLRSVTVTIPAGATSGGHIAVMGVSNVNCTDATCPPLPTTNGQVGWDTVLDTDVENPKGWANGGGAPLMVTAIDQFTFSAPGTYTLYLRANCVGPGNCQYTNISAVAWFIPR
jgi:hypothetical protein